MINLTTDCRKIATLLSAFLAVVSYSNVALPIFQQDPVSDSTRVDVTAAAPTPRNSDFDLLMRGPLHEAFAEVYQPTPTPAQLIQQQPPQDIEELPPEIRPDGKNVQWVSGYWAWDDERVDFIWVSGIWRDLPPGKRWNPGYWVSENDGYRWVTGFWSNEKQTLVTYLPQPPDSIDNGPSSAAPSDDHYFIPGNWVYRDTNYLWQAGFWAPRRNNWIWAPACYYWTPHGCIYRPGYWDYEIDCRGVVFAPVYFRTLVFRHPGYHYTPTYLINTNYDFLVHLFVRTTCNRYYFGDWYGADYLTQGYYSWSSISWANELHRYHDPLYAYYNCRSSRYKNAGLMTWIRSQHRFYDENRDCRPRHTFVAQSDYARSNRHHENYDAIQKATLGEDYKTHVRHTPDFKGDTPAKSISRKQLARRVEEKIRRQSIDRFNQLRLQRIDDQTRRIRQKNRTDAESRIAKTQTDTHRQTQNLATQERAQRQNEHKRREQQERSQQRFKETELRVQQQHAELRRAQHQRITQQRAQRHAKEAELRVQRKSDIQQRMQQPQVQKQQAWQQRARKQQAQPQRKALQQRDKPQQAQQIRAEQKRAEQQRALQQRDKQNRALQQRALQQRAQQQRAQQQRAQQQRAQQQRAQQQRAQQQRAQQQRAQQQRAQQQRAQKLRDQQQRAQQQAQKQRAQREIRNSEERRQRQIPQSKKKRS